MNDQSLLLTIRGRKYTPEISFKVGKCKIFAKSVQTEVDAGYEGRDKIVLIEAKKYKLNKYDYSSTFLSEQTMGKCY